MKFLLVAIIYKITNNKTCLGEKMGHHHMLVADWLSVIACFISSIFHHLRVPILEAGLELEFYL
jgi:hypothetical protein